MIPCNYYQAFVQFSFHIWSTPQDIFKQATEDRLTSAKELPYFEGDFWPNVLEESIKELEQEEEERKREENSTSNESIDVRLPTMFPNMALRLCVASWGKMTWHLKEHIV